MNQNDQGRWADDGGRWDDEHGWFEKLTPAQEAESRENAEKTDLTVHFRGRYSVQHTR